MLTAERLRELLDYDPETGSFTWRVRRGSRASAGAVVNGCPSRGYRTIRVDGRNYLSHRLAWLHYYGEWPAKGIDHINGTRSDNRLSNLREANQSENMANHGLKANNKSGFKGVSWSAERRMWQAHIMVNYRSKFLGCYGTPKEAHSAYCAAATKYFGEYARTE